MPREFFAEKTQKRRSSGIRSALLLICLMTIGAPQARRNRQFILGADISWVDQDIDRGTRYYDGTTGKDIFDILASRKFNLIRLRTFVDPTANPGSPEAPYSTAGYCDLAHTIEFAKNIKARGMLFLLDFHYSDLWCDPGKQFKPVSWADLPFDDLVEQVRTYTRESLEACKAAGVLPDMVQVGNEIVNGVIWPDGSTDNMEQFAALVNAGIDGVKDVSDDIEIMIHSVAENSPDWWIGNLIKAGVDRIDIFGLSYYSEWHGTPDSLKKRLLEITEHHPMRILIAEYADNHEAVNDIMFDLPDGMGLGTVVWEPTRWRETLFTNNRTNERIDLYPQLAERYGNDTLPLKPPPVGIAGRERWKVSRNRPGDILSASMNSVTVFTLQGKRVRGGFVGGNGRLNTLRQPGTNGIRTGYGVYVITAGDRQEPAMYLPLLR